MAKMKTEEEQNMPLFVLLSLAGVGALAALACGASADSTLAQYCVPLAANTPPTAYCILFWLATNLFLPYLLEEEARCCFRA